MDNTERSKMVDGVLNILCNIEDGNASVIENHIEPDVYEYDFKCEDRQFTIVCDGRGFTLRLSDFAHSVPDMQFLALFMMCVGMDGLGDYVGWGFEK